MGKLVAMVAMMVFCAAGAANALSLYYEVGADSSIFGSALSDPGLEIEYAFDAGLVGHSFWLDDGQQTTFDFFDIWTDENYVHLDDLFSQTIYATLDFDAPDAHGTVEGNTVAATFLAAFSWGEVTWNGPQIVTVADRQFEIALSDETFSGDWGLGLDPGQGQGATVQATVRQVWGVQGNQGNQVPDGGATLAMLGLTLVGLGILRRK